MSSIQLSDSSELALAILNAQINGSSGMNLTTALDAVRNRTDEINICGIACGGSCTICTQSEENLRTFFALDATAAVTEPLPTDDERWEEIEQAARARDEVEEAARNGSWADTVVDEDHHDNRRFEDDEISRCPCGCEDESDDSDYDDRQDYSNWDYGGGLDWNDSGYFD